ncbi:MAG: hypothetical protein KDA75_14865, partial [Planctomycetaceae bacterium]|nr:hypothetical protein [Planctomycetaceae bacterium]
IDFNQLLPIVEAPLAVAIGITDLECEMSEFDETAIAELTSEEIRYKLSREELVDIIRGVDYPFAGKERLQFFDRDTLERVVHLVRRWCQSRVCA